MNHGGSWSVYFTDPENNPIEFFAYTQTYAPPIATVPMDMKQSFQQLMEETEALIRQFPESIQWNQWRERFSKNMAG